MALSSTEIKFQMLSPCLSTLYLPAAVLGGCRSRGWALSSAAQAEVPQDPYPSLVVSRVWNGKALQGGRLEPTSLPGPTCPPCNLVTSCDTHILHAPQQSPIQLEGP